MLPPIHRARNSLLDTEMLGQDAWTGCGVWKSATQGEF